MTALIQKYLPVISILLLAAYLRWFNVGLEPLSTDGSVISLKAIDVSRHGRPTLLGTVMSVGFWHSPFSIYLYSIPYALSPDPRLARLFTGAVNVIAVALVYFIGARFFSRPAGLLASLLYAVHPEALFTGRGIWNPHLGAPFVMLYVATGLMGYYRQSRPARLAHLSALSLGLQCHPAAALLLPITALLFGYAMWRQPKQRLAIISETIIGGVLAALTLLPWGVGLYLGSQGGGAQTEVAALPNRGWGYTLTTMYEALGYWRKDYTQAVVPALTALGSLWLAARAVRRRDGLPGLVIVLGFFLVPALALALDAKYRPFYLASAFPNAFLIQGALIGGVAGELRVNGRGARFWNWRGLVHTPYLRWVAPPLVSLVVALHLMYAFTPPESYLGPRYSLDEQINAIRLAKARAIQTGRDLIILAPDTGSEPPYSWELLNEGLGARVVWHGRALPLPVNGAAMIGFADYAARDFVFSGGEAVGKYFRLVDLPPADRFAPDLRPVQPVRLSNGATLLGFLRPSPHSLPAADERWTIFLIWRVDRPGASDDKVFVHLVNANGDKFAQADVPGLPAGQQRAGEWVMNQFDFDIGDGLPTTGPLFLRFGMYSENGQAKVIDGAGNAIGDYALIQIRGEAQPLIEWEGGLALDDLAVSDSIEQGPPLNVAATWRIAQPLDDGAAVRWRLLDAAGSAVFEQDEALVAGLPPGSIPTGVFASQQYVLRIPTDIPAGEYTLEVQPTDGGRARGEPYRRAITVTARARRFEMPAVEHTIGAAFADKIKLLGYDLRQDGALLHITLHWRALAAMERDYKYFVHVWRDGQIVAQVDAMPGAYQYPTSWWAAGEVVSEAVTLDLSSLEPGVYRLSMGFYEPDDGERLPVTLADGSRAVNDWVELQTVELK